MVADPFQPSVSVAPPGAETPAVSMEPASFTGTVRAWDKSAYETEILPDRTIDRWMVGFENEMSDPRLSGVGEAMDYLETIPSGAHAFFSHTGVGRLTNDGGTFAVECTGAGRYDSEGYIACWYEGLEGYDGLTAFMLMRQRDPGGFDAEGWVYPAKRPPLLDYDPS
jgi:hypothetical protein